MENLVIALVLRQVGTMTESHERSWNLKAVFRNSLEKLVTDLRDVEIAHDNHVFVDTRILVSIGAHRGAWWCARPRNNYR